MGVKRIDMVHHLMDRYGEIAGLDLNENHKISDKALDTTTPVGNND